MKEMRSKGVEGLASNILCNGNRLGWMELFSRLQHCCNSGGRPRHHGMIVDPRILSNMVSFSLSTRAVNCF